MVDNQRELAVSLGSSHSEYCSTFPSGDISQSSKPRAFHRTRHVNGVQNVLINRFDVLEALIESIVKRIDDKPVRCPRSLALITFASRVSLHAYVDRERVNASFLELIAVSLATDPDGTCV